MAAPKTIPTKLQQETTRAAIQTTQLVKRLQAYALGQNDPNNADPDAGPLDLDTGRLKAIEILLRKTLPDLAAVTLSGEGKDGAIKTEEVGQGAAKLAAILAEIAVRSGTTGSAGSD